MKRWKSPAPPSTDAAAPRMRRMRESRRCDPHLPGGAGSSASHGCR
jgi:hypothetical protein